MKRGIFAIDSTTLQLSLDCIDWARHCRKKAAEIKTFVSSTMKDVPGYQPTVSGMPA